MVDEEAQVILAQSVSNQAADAPHLMEMIGITEANLGAADIEEDPDTVIADAGYLSEKNVTDVTDAGVDVSLPRAHQAPRAGADSTERSHPKRCHGQRDMARRLRTKAGRADYARRKAIVEPVFGQMKVRQGAGFLRLRGLQGARVRGSALALPQPAKAGPSGA